MGGRLPALLESHDHHGGEGLPGVQTQAAVFRGRGAQVLRGAGAQPERTGKETDGPKSHRRGKPRSKLLMCCNERGNIDQTDRQTDMLLWLVIQ